MIQYIGILSLEKRKKHGGIISVKDKKIKYSAKKREEKVMSYVEIAVFAVVVLVLSPFVAYALATFGIFFTRLESGNIKFIVIGDSLRKMIYNTPGFELVDGKFQTTTEKQTRPFLGLYWVGWPPFSRVHKFKITKETENPDGKTPEEWIMGGKEEIEVDTLRFTFPRPYVLKTVELKDRVEINVLAVAKFEVVSPYIPVFNFKGKFFENAGADIRATISDILKGYTLDEFIIAPKGEIDGILSPMKDPTGAFNQKLIEQVGIRLVGITIPQYDPGDQELRNAMNARTIAEEQGQATLAKARYDSEAQERLAKARGVRILETVAAMASTLGSPDVVARGVADVLEMEAATGENSQLTTLVKGNAQPVVPVGEGGKK